MKILNSEPSKIGIQHNFNIKIMFKLIATAFVQLAYAEEQSILEGATSSPWQKGNQSYNDNALCDGGFRSKFSTTMHEENGDGTKEVKIILTQE